MATVDNGTVNAVAAGAATITATIVVEGVTYSDSCDVTVDVAPISNVVFDLTAAENWGDPSLWFKQAYLDDTRGAYIAYDNGRLYCHYNPDGTGTLYADIAPYAGEFVYDDSFNYFLEFSYDNPGLNTYKLNTAGNENSVFKRDNSVWPGYFPNTQTSETVLLPLVLSVESAPRLITLQIRMESATEINPLSFTARVIREPK